MTMTAQFRICIVLFIIFGLLASCATNKQLYKWGHYENSIYDMYVRPGKISIEDEKNRLEVQIEETVGTGEFVPPGLHAHLAYLYFSLGDHATGMAHLQTEKRKFPESTHFIDGIIKRMQK